MRFNLCVSTCNAENMILTELFILHRKDYKRKITQMAIRSYQTQKKKKPHRELGSMDCVTELIPP